MELLLANMHIAYAFFNDLRYENNK